jgi:hypothetical protein
MHKQVLQVQHQCNWQLHLCISTEDMVPREDDCIDIVVNLRITGIKPY